MSRFSKIMTAMGVITIHAVATAAVRRAHNGEAFTAAEAILGQPIQVLSQQEEAHYVSRGLTLNIAEASGLVADLGGGSLEVVALHQGEVQHSTSFNFGHLSDIDEDAIPALADTPWIAQASGVVSTGSAGRSVLGLAYIEQTGYPLRFFTAFASREMMRTSCSALSVANRLIWPACPLAVREPCRWRRGSCARCCATAARHGSPSAAPVSATG